MEIIKKNWKIKLISLVIAIFMWSYIIASTNPTMPIRLTGIPIVFENLEEQNDRGLLISPDTQKYVDITLIGQRNRIINITNSHIRVTADFDGLDEGLHNIRLNYALPDGISLEEYQSSVDVRIERIIDRNYPVEVVTKGTLPADYILESRQVVPESIAIRGARSNLDRIDKVISELDLSMLTSNTNINQALKAVDESGATVENITYGQEFVNVSAVVYKQKEVPIEIDLVGETSQNYKIDSTALNRSTVFIKGPGEIIDSVESVKTQEINVENITESKKIPVNLLLPTDVSMVSDDTEYSLEIVVQGKVNKTLEIPQAKIQLSDSTKAENVVINSEVGKVVLNGFQDDLDKITEENITLVLDITGKQMGSHQIKPKVKIDGKDPKEGLVQSVENISITISN